MNSQTVKPFLYILPDGGYRVGFDEEPGLFGAGDTVPAALKALSAEIARRYDTEKGDETSEAQTAARQADILANDRFLRGHQLQNSVTMALALGLI